MKRNYKILRWIILILLVILFLLIFAKSIINSNQNNKDLEEIDYSNIKPSIASELSEVIVDNKIEISVSELTPITLKLKISNKTNEEFYYKDDFSLEEMIDGKWYKLKTYEDIDLSDTQNDILPKEIHLKSYKWDNIYGKLSVGKYRIIKIFNDENNKRVFVSSAEFTIE